VELQLKGIIWGSQASHDKASDLRSREEHHKNKWHSKQLGGRYRSQRLGISGTGKEVVSLGTRRKERKYYQGGPAISFE